MSDTQPYAAVSAVTAAASVSASERDREPTERFLVELAGRLFLQPGGEARALKVFDAHPELGAALRVGFDGIEPRRSFIEVDGQRWARLRRGLVLCASFAVAGQIVVARPGAWRLAIDACGEPVGPVRRSTARLTSPHTHSRARPWRRR